MIFSLIKLAGIFVEAATSKLFIAKPTPNIIFQRDPFASIVHGISLHSMTFETRRRETLFAEVVFDKHPDYNKVKRYYNRDRQSTLEGGDVMMLNKKTLAVGISQRTETQSLEFLAKNIFNDDDNSIETIYAIKIPKGRS
jgi:arginine deiminase